MTDADYRLYLDAKFESLHEKLDAIKERVDKTNGSVAKHEKVISQNLPHTIVHCAQAETIRELKENMISSKSMKNTLYLGFGILGGLIAILWGLKEIFFK